MDKSRAQYSMLIEIFVLGITFIVSATLRVRIQTIPDSKVHEDNMGPIWANRTQVGPMLAPRTFFIWELIALVTRNATNVIAIHPIRMQDKYSCYPQTLVWVHSAKASILGILWNFILCFKKSF